MELPQMLGSIFVSGFDLAQLKLKERSGEIDKRRQIKDSLRFCLALGKIEC
jgi:hypothetical protein